MVKKLFRMAITFALLSAVYTGYTRGFAFVAEQVSTRKTVPMLPVLPGMSRSQKEAADLLVAAFGPDNWAEKAPMSYYDVKRGYWIYWHDYRREADGKTWEFWPAWIITRSQKDGALKTISGKKARVEFNRPIDMGKPGEGDAHIVHARLDEDVRIRDDKGTADLIDDLTVGPLKVLEYDEAKAEIVSTTEEEVILRDRGLTARGIGMRMELRPAAPTGDEAKPADGPAGFDGVQAICLLRDVEIDVQDVGRSGIVPGGDGGPDKLVMADAADGKTVAKTEPRPGHIQCSGAMRIDLPRPIRNPRIGPPAPPAPTIATFHRNVRVRQGDPLHPEQADGDHLVATLLPAEKPPTDKAKLAQEKAARKAEGASGTAAADPKDQAKAEGEGPAAPAEGGPLSGLVLHRAVMTGHAVWLQSEARGTKAVGNQLIFDRQAIGQADRIFFVGDKYTEVVKTETYDSGPDLGKPRSLSTIRTKDVTIFQYPPGGPPPSVVARGPGTLETRAAGRDEVERFASWQDTLTMVTPPGSEGRKITLTGHPRVRSATQGDITALRTIVADLKPKANRPEDAVEVVSADGQPAYSTSKSEGDALRIEKLVADGDVRLVTIATEADPTATPPRAASPSRTVVARDTLTADFVDLPAPVVADAEGQPAAEAPLAAVPSAVPALPVAEAAPIAPAGPAPKPKPADPAMTAIADTVWALVEQQPGSDKGQVKEARLTGDVEVHQDPAEGKTQGMDLTGKVVFLKNSGENRAEVQAQGTRDEPAKAVTEGRTIVGTVLNLDQATDYAWVSGPGYLETEQAETDMFDDTAPIGEDLPEALAEAPKPKPPARKKGPLYISWGKSADDKDAQMHFYGQTAESQGESGPAMAYFFSHVRARTDDSSLACEEVLKVTFDGPIAFVKPKRTEPKAEADEEDRKPQVAILHARGDVDIVARKVDPETGAFKDKKRIRHQDVTYDKAVGEFTTGEGPGETFLYTTGKDKTAQGPMVGAAPGRRVVQPVSARRGADAAAEAPKISLTHVRFNKQMKGRFAPAEDARPQEYSTATFLGGVEAMMATVADENIEIDADRPPRDFYRIVSRNLDVVVEPPAVKTATSTDRYWLDATGNAKAFTRDTAIAGERITYDSLKELSYVYGSATAGVAMVQQDGAGQPATIGRGSALYHNHKTGYTQLIDPQTFQIIDRSSGSRSNLAKVEPPPMSGRNVKGLAAPNAGRRKPDRNDPTVRAKQLRLPNSGDKDRKSFTGK